MKILLASAIIALLVWMPLHALYWRLLRPVILTRLRYRLFAVRDRLRLLVLNNEVPEKCPAYPILELHCNRWIRILDYGDVAELVWAGRDTEAMLRAQRDLETIEEAPLALRQAYEEMMQAIIGAVLVNSPAAVVFAAALYVAHFWFRWARERFRQAQAGAWGIPYAERDGMVPAAA